jgi:aryl-alcohol dehydrogenase-like predicted oxidoreductase
MEYEQLGQTDLKVSKICLGTMTWGEQNSMQEAFAQIDMALDYGVNFIDVAEMYPVPPRAETQGETERILGQWLAQSGRRDDVVVATKVTGPSTRMAYLRGGPRLSAQQIQQAVQDSLRRLRTDVIDLYQIHWPDRPTNFFGKLGYVHHAEADAIAIEETLMACEQLVRSGMVRHIGISNETPWGMHEYLRLSEAGQGPRIVSIQNPYNLLNRTFEIGLAEMAIREQVGLLAYSPLAFGVLSGKYLGGLHPEGARLSLFNQFTRYSSPTAARVTEQLFQVAQQAQLDLAQMALAFVNQQPFVTANIIGATQLDQLKSNLESIDIQLSAEVLAQLEEIHSMQPNPCP